MFCDRIEVPIVSHSMRIREASVTCHSRGDTAGVLPMNMLTQSVCIKASYDCRCF